MELYTLDANFNRQEVIDVFESLIWTERYSEIGDFELDISTSVRMKGLLRPGVWLAMNESNRIMNVETVIDSIDADGKQMLKVTGVSMESILKQRLTEPPGAVWGLFKDYMYLGFPADIVRQLFTHNCIEPYLDSNRYHFLSTSPQPIYPKSTIPEPGDSIYYKRELKSLFDSMKDIMDAFWLGFRILRDPVTAVIYWDVYAGNDRTASQTTWPAIIFSHNLNTLENTREISDISNYKNVFAMGLGVNSMGGPGPLFVYEDGRTAAYIQEPLDAPKGLARRVVGAIVETSSDDPNNLSPLDQGYSYGKINLGKYPKIYALDGEVNQYGDYIYDVDYNLGDRVEMQASDGFRGRMIVTEHIFVADGEGERSYPTLTLENSSMPGAWATYDPNGTWSTRSTDETWSTEP